ncbi:MAG: hypothetical protein JRN52_08180 [Nitrososphaerota archaeon]|nr:hypothetical protein [Nitrososphaerota archaeon]
MATSYSMVIGGGLLMVGIVSILISWLSLRGVDAVTSETPTMLAALLLGFVFCTVGLFFLFFRHIRLAQI